MKYVVSRYNHDITWLASYTSDAIIYDRSPEPIKGSIVVPNIGSDIYDKLSFIIDNYDNLPEVALYTKANIYKYITQEEFHHIKDNQTFTPILSKQHPETMCDMKLCKQLGVAVKPFSFYDEGMYYELNYPAYLATHPVKNQIDIMNNDINTVMKWFLNLRIMKDLKLDKLEYIPFAPGSNYILPKANILKHPKKFYQKLRNYLKWSAYPGEAMICERGLYLLWKD